MSLGKSVAVPKLTLLGAIVFLIGLAVAVVLLGNGSANVTAVITLICAAVVPNLLGLYQTQLNGTKADDAATAAGEAKDTAAAVATRTDQIHGLVNGGLENRIRSVLIDILEARLGPPEHPVAAQSDPPPLGITPPPFPMTF